MILSWRLHTGEQSSVAAGWDQVASDSLSVTRREFLLRTLLSPLLTALPSRAMGIDEPSPFAPLRNKILREGRFSNPWGVQERKFGDFLLWVFRLKEREEPPFPYNPGELRLPRCLSPDPLALKDPDPTRLLCTWIGHSTFLIQYQGVTILTDPIFSEMAGPGNLVGSRRVVPPALTPEALPPPDLILISHNHYDHCDPASLKHWAPHSRVVVPLGVKELLKPLGFSHLEEWGWGERKALSPKLTLHCVPAQHFSGRTLFDRNATLWCGYVLEFPDATVYFAGDTGFAPFFQELREFYREITLALLPIGAYRPRWFMGPVHLDPPEAVEVHEILNAHTSLGMHWGTFSLADEPLGEPPLYLRWVLKQRGISPERFRVLEIGETTSL